MSERKVTLASGTVVTVSATWATKTEFGSTVEDHKHIIDRVRVERAGKEPVEGSRYLIETRMAPETRPELLAALDACIDELTGTTKAEREAAREAKDAEARDYDKHTETMRKAMGY